jgi:hypothetical protein
MPPLRSKAETEVITMTLCCSRERRFKGLAQYHSGGVRPESAL